MQILLGCGGDRLKRLHAPGKRDWVDLVTLDIEPAHKPDVVHDLNDLPYPFASDSADEIHAYEVLEHVGRQGDAAFFFAQWDEFYRILKPGGMVYMSVPKRESVWAWGDPGHTRIITKEQLGFLHRPAYVHVGSTPMSDYRRLFVSDWDVAEINAGVPDLAFFALQAVKPARG
mgnify:CR=1 FL=1